MTSSGPRWPPRPPTRRRRRAAAANLGRGTGAIARRRHRRWLVFAVIVLVVIVAGLIAGFIIWRSTADEIPDFAGQGDTEVVVRVQSGDGIDDIAKTLADAGVVASPEAFQNQAAAGRRRAGVAPRVLQGPAERLRAGDRGCVGGQGESGRSGAADPRQAAGRRHRGVDRSERRHR